MLEYIKLHEEHSTSPLTISPMHNGWASDKLIKLLDGIDVGRETFSTHEKNGLQFFCEYDAWDRGSSYLHDTKLKDKKFVKMLFDMSVKLANELVKLVREFDKGDLSKLSNKQLADFLKKTYQMGNDLSVLGYIPVLSDIYFHKLTHQLKSIVKYAMEKYDVGLAEPEIVCALSTSSKPIPSKLARLALLKLVAGKKNDEKGLLKYYHDWSWVDHGQIGPRTGSKQIAELVTKLRSDLATVRREIEDIKSSARLLKNKQSDLIKKMHLTKSDIQWLNVAQTFMYLKGMRMEVLFGSSAEWSRVLDELYSRFGVKKELLYYASIGELVGWLSGNKKVSVKILSDRQKFCVWIAHDATHQTILTGEKARKFLQTRKYKALKTQTDILVIHGTVASVGYAKGPVRIVNRTEEINKIQQGDIMVSVATHPGLLPAMKKAIAFVTDSGGVTSHAAIVAREMKKPCIIGTKVATQILKDGDWIEVDTKRGDIRRVKN